MPRCCTAQRQSCTRANQVCLTGRFLSKYTCVLAVGTPDAGAFFRAIEQHKVNALFVAPTAFRGIRQEDPHGDHIKKHDVIQYRTWLGAFIFTHLDMICHRCGRCFLPASGATLRHWSGRISRSRCRRLTTTGRLDDLIAMHAMNEFMCCRPRLGGPYASTPAKTASHWQSSQVPPASLCLDGTSASSLIRSQHNHDRCNSI